MDYVLPLEHCGRSVLDRVGGKAVGLWELLRRGLPVPAGFAVTTHAYREFVRSERLDREIRWWVERARESVDAQLEASRRIGQLFTERRPPAFLTEEVARAYGQLGEPPVAVRSSAVGEDARTASFAGEHESYLWVCGYEEVAASVLRCWASLFSPQALSYFAHLGADPAEAAMGVVVQHMVDAQVAGVMITLDPVTGDPSQVTVEASYGLGL
ncbi:MAG: PEP/pyruvate-binding domain-containing protein, partial [Armatimonadota bacterium]|nr:PEP/pyruvate-binding domain-containing protein [Armatimonadota bacterium]